MGYQKKGLLVKSTNWVTIKLTITVKAIGPYIREVVEMYYLYIISVLGCAIYLQQNLSQCRWRRWPCHGGANLSPLRRSLLQVESIALKFSITNVYEWRDVFNPHLSMSTLACYPLYKMCNQHSAGSPFRGIHSLIDSTCQEGNWYFYPYC